METKDRNKTESQAWQASRETQGTITILDPSILD